VAWYTDNSSKTQTVGTKSANQLGIYDMSGNVYEWLWDWRVTYPPGPETDYQGPSTGTFRVIRGGGYTSIADWVRVGRRDAQDPWVAASFYGFRPARTP
jgi:formylglycine-generating enzyme required for sulfatase activity